MILTPEQKANLSAILWEARKTRLDHFTLTDVLIDWIEDQAAARGEGDRG